MSGDVYFEPGHKEPAADSGELALVSACLAGRDAALVRLKQEYGGYLRAGAAHVCADPSFVDEVVARAWASLVSGDAPKLAGYSGRGPLPAWLRIVAARSAIDLCRSEQRRRARERASEAQPVASVVDPGHILDRARHGDSFGRALRAALRALDSRQRELLQLRFRDGLELSALSQRFGVHRATLQRWLSSATSDLRKALTRELSQNGTCLSPSELAGLGRQLHSALRPAVASWFGSPSNCEPTTDTKEWQP